MRCMLTRLFSSVLIRALLLCALLCAAIPALGARQTAPDEAWLKFGFAACDLPCYAGIMPGQTSFDQVTALLTRHIAVIDPLMIDGGASINFWGWIASQQLSGLIRYNQGQVGEIRLDLLLPVGELIEHLGAPDCILSGAGSDAQADTVIFWERQGVSIGAVLAPDPQAINLSANALALWLRDVQPEDCALRGAIRWQGFAPLWDYTP